MSLPRGWRLLAPAALAASAWAQAAPAVIEDSLAQRLQACTVCHGASDERAADAYRPRLAGKPAGYLLHQLLNFRDGRRHYGPMVALVDGLPEPFLHEIAAHFAALDLPHQPLPRATNPADPAQLALGRRLALQGDAARRLPACTACHGQRLTGALPATPGLLGLPRDYLAAQLGAWQHGERRALAPDCMAELAQRLRPEDVAALTTWLAEQPLPQPYRPDASVPQPAPLRCGSVVDSGGAAAARAASAAGSASSQAAPPTARPARRTRP